MLNCFRHRGSRLGFVAYSLSPQKVDATVVSDPKQPRLQRSAFIKLIQLPIGLDQGFLYDVFAVHD
jgi:hypothetical protein